MSKRAWVFAVLIFLAAAMPAAAQFTAQEVAERDSWESFLKSAAIVASEPAGEGVTKPYRLTLKRDGVETRGFWKNVDEKLPNGAMDSWRYEIAAYRLDKLLGLNMVPVAVEREFNGRPGSLSLFAKSRYSLLKVMDDNIPIPASVSKAFDKAKYITRAFDCLIANDDRTQQNILVTEDWRTILIDFSRAFRSDKEHVERLIYGQNGIKLVAGRPALFRQLPRSLVQAIRGLDEARVRQAVGPYLTDQEIGALMARRVLLLQEIEGMIKEKGEANVLY